MEDLLNLFNKQTSFQSGQYSCRLVYLFMLGRLHTVVDRANEIRNTNGFTSYLVRDYSDVQRLFCQTSWGRGTSELVPYQKVDICPPKIYALLRRFWCRLTALELYKSGINLFIFHLFFHLCKFHLPANLYFSIF